MSENVDAWIEGRLRRLDQPDGKCLHCEQPADRKHLIGPIVIRITYPSWTDPAQSETFPHEFCTWECLGHWAAIQAGAPPDYPADPRRTRKP